MGRETKNFRQSKRSSSGDYGNKSYAKINRTGSWEKIINFFKKGGYYGKS